MILVIHQKNLLVIMRVFPCEMLSKKVAEGEHMLRSNDASHRNKHFLAVSAGALTRVGCNLSCWEGELEI